PTGEALKATTELARVIAAKAPVALRYAKEAVVKGLGLPLADGLRLGGDLSTLLRTTEDRVEGGKAFLEKRPPRWTGKGESIEIEAVLVLRAAHAQPAGRVPPKRRDHGHPASAGRALPRRRRRGGVRSGRRGSCRHPGSERAGHRRTHGSARSTAGSRRSAGGA